MKAYNLKQVMRKAWAIYKAGTRNFSLALKEAWKVIKQLNTGVVTFWKLSDGSTTTRRIAPLSQFGIEPKGNSKPGINDLFSFIDLDKIAAGIAPKDAVIGFHLYQVIL